MITGTKHAAPAAAASPGRHADFVLRLLRRHGPLTRGELASLSGLSRTTLYEVIGALTDNGSVIASVPRATQRKRGRPAEKLALNPEAGRVIGIDFAPRAVHVATMTVVHHDISTAGAPHPPDTPWPDRVGIARQLADTLVGGTLRPDIVGGVGMSVAGPLRWPGDRATGAVDDRAVTAMVRRRFGTRTRLETRTRLVALAETVWGAAAGRQDVLYLSLSHSVGGALVTGGTLYRGAHGLAGEFGHITVEPGGAICGCGGRGCLQTVASTTAVLDAYRGAADVPELVAALNAGDPVARAVLKRAATHIGRVLADLSNALGPGMVVLGGELVDTGPALMEPLESALRVNAVRCGRRPPLLVRPAELGDSAAALGALALLLRPGAVPTCEPGRSADARVPKPRRPQPS